MIIEESCAPEMNVSNAFTVREALEKFERSKILEIYFSRLDGRDPQEIPEGFEELYSLELNEIKNFLLGQHPQDALLQKVFRMMN